VVPQGEHHGPMTHDDDIVNPGRTRRPVERGAGPGFDFQTRFAAGRLPRPVGSAIVPRTVDIVRQAGGCAFVPLANIRLDPDRGGETCRRDIGALARRRITPRGSAGR
jgi:hypothetical protein